MLLIWQEVYTIFSQHPSFDSAFGSIPKTLTYIFIMRSLDLPEDAYHTIPHYLISPSIRNAMFLISTSHFSLRKFSLLIEIIYLIS